ncbi:unnamed protein product, partial [Nesidiocoris tenuis]
VSVCLRVCVPSLSVSQCLTVSVWLKSQCVSSLSVSQSVRVSVCFRVSVCLRVSLSQCVSECQCLSVSHVSHKSKTVMFHRTIPSSSNLRHYQLKSDRLAGRNREFLNFGLGSRSENSRVTRRPLNGFESLPEGRYIAGYSENYPKWFSISCLQCFTPMGPHHHENLDQVYAT